MLGFRRFLLSSCVIACVGASPALAQDVPSFTPAKAWSVQATVNSNDQCALRTEFNNGFVVQFIGQRDWLQAIDINFRQQVFETGKSYDAVLSVPGRGAKPVKATARDSATLSLPIQGEKSLIDNLQESAVLELDVEGNAFRFILTGIDNAKSDFSGCLGGGNAASQVASQTDNFQYENRMSAGEDLMASPTVPARQKPESFDLMSNAPAVPVSPSPRPMKRPDVSPHTSLSAQLAAEMAANPDLVDGDETAVKTQTFAPDAPKLTEDRTLEMPPNFDTAPIEQAMPAPQPVSIDMPEAVTQPAPVQPSLPSVQHGKQRIIQSEPILSTDEASVISANTNAVTPEPPKEDIIVKRQAVTPSFEPETQPAAIMPAPSTKVEVETPPARREIKVTTERFKGNADFTRSEPEVDTGRLARLSALEKEVSVLRAENAALNEELDQDFDAGAKKRVEISTDNWNLEQATKRYNEAERQIKRLGQQLRQERAAAEM